MMLISRDWSGALVKPVLTGFYCLGVVIVQLTLEAHSEQLWRMLYMSFAPLMLVARFCPWQRLAVTASVLAIGVLITGGILSPLELEVIEESFIIIPLLYLALYPGRPWAFICSLLLLIPYLYGSGEELFENVLEDCLELIIITAFASVMTYYQQRSYRLMLGYRDESRTDYLTQLKNRLAYSISLRTLEKRSVQERCLYALLLIDLDDFKRINDLHGHSYGDLLLKQFARRICKLDFLNTYRIGGDEFAILLRESENMNAEKAAEAIYAVSREPYDLGNRSLEVGLSIGVARYTGEIQGSEELERNADLALFQAKQAGKNKVSFFEPTILKARELQDKLARDMGAALAAGEFFVVYQPKVDMRTGCIVGAEALLRWEHPELGMISPAEFIPVAEMTRQIVPLGRWVLEQACLQAATWQQRGATINLSVNVSGMQFKNDNMVQVVDDALTMSGLPAAQLDVEITETTLMDDSAFIIPLLEQLRERGVGLAVDDFGVAYSSLNQLKTLPVTVLKIDKSFVDHCHTDTQDLMIIRSIIQLASNLNLSLVAEGVEAKAQAELLLQEGCLVAQGFFYYRPLDAQSFENLLLPPVPLQQDLG
ncbi:putative bifunctional diguanylate cyclase/phosphodiesterase [Oleidesulfovibrio sp.]|uniref:putative bifunctional diguanylate cyclase/phosphodiesterase n=1 Tax=Oleidesulfovibrio sp. TaxID=2909707 RepID=UPI003A840F53